MSSEPAKHLPLLQKIKLFHLKHWRKNILHISFSSTPENLCHLLNMHPFLCVCTAKLSQNVLISWSPMKRAFYWLGWFIFFYIFFLTLNVFFLYLNQLLIKECKQCLTYATIFSFFFNAGVSPFTNLEYSFLCLVGMYILIKVRNLWSGEVKHLGTLVAVWTSVFADGQSG